MADAPYGFTKNAALQPAISAVESQAAKAATTLINTATNALSAALSSNPFSYGVLSFPSNFGDNTGLSDYILININENTANAPPASGNSNETINAQAQAPNTPQREANISKTLNASDPEGNVGKKQGRFVVQGEQGNSSTQKSFSSSNRKRIKTSIILPLPTSAISATYGADWQAAGLGSAGGSLDRFNAGAAAFRTGASVTGAIKAGAGDPKELAAITGYSAVPEDLKAGLEKNAGYALNPRTEVTYKGTPNRTFQFDFKLSPRNKAEAEDIERIIHTLKYAQAPELTGEFGSWLKYPDDFDVGLYFKGERNRHVHRISSCALINLTVDYSGGQGGMPNFDDGFAQTILLSLQFIELEMITKNRISEGY